MVAHWDAESAAWSEKLLAPWRGERKAYWSADMLVVLMVLV